MKKWLYNFTKKRNQVSIIIPTYRNVQFLLECINSILLSAKNYCDFEILLGIDNCYSTLNFVFENSIFKNKKIKVHFFSKNIGPYIIRNTLVEKTKYENILFFDSDDVMMKKSIPKILEALEEYEIVKFKFYNFQDGVNYKNNPNQKISSMCAHGAFAIKKQCFYKLFGFLGWKCGADTEFLERYEALKYVCYNFEESLFYRRYHGNNITKTKETGINSEFREKYRQYIYDNRKTGIWKCPEKLQTFFCSEIKI